jgi:transcriptional regulator with XRE-family HTH domain
MHDPGTMERIPFIEEHRDVLCHRLKDARKYLRFKQEEVAAYLKVPISAISAMETGSRRVDAIELFLLSKLYNRPLEWFFMALDEDENDPAFNKRWYDRDPVLQHSIKLLQQAPKPLQQNAARGLIGFLKDLRGAR